jgi:predicted TIM-barrel fold metal-dependent hydrolase
MNQPPPTAQPPPARPPDPDTRTPALKAPSGACDTHCHVFGPAVRYPFAGVRRYTPPDCPIEDYLAMAGTVGLERAVLVQASAHGTDNRVTLDAIARTGGRFRGVAIVDSSVSDGELERLHRGGMRGARMNTMGGGGVGIEHMDTLARRVSDLGWAIELHLRNADELVDLAPRLSALPGPCIIDHFGRVRGGQGVDNAGFQALLRLIRDDDKCWVKLASFYRLSDSGPPDYADMTPIARALIGARPDRLIWGSNWPHPSHQGEMPNDGDLFDKLAEWAPEAEIRRQILVDNPTALFWAG